MSNEFLKYCAIELNKQGIEIELKEIGFDSKIKSIPEFDSFEYKYIKLTNYLIESDKKLIISYYE